MIDRFAAEIMAIIAGIIAWRINNYCEKHTLVRLLNQVHFGASTEWISEIVEERGRHALVIAHH